MALVTRVSYILSDVLVLGLTWWKVKPSQDWSSTSIYTLLLRDGQQRFCCRRPCTDLGFQALYTSRTDKNLTTCHILLTATHGRRVLLIMNIAEVVILHYVRPRLVVQYMRPTLTTAFSRNFKPSLLVLSSSTCEHRNLSDERRAWY